MNQATLDILIFAAIALFLFFKLRSVLGDVDEADQNSKSSTKTDKVKKAPKVMANERLAKLNPQQGPGEWPTPLPDFKLVTDATAHNALLQIHTSASDFDPYHFIQGAKRAFSMIIEAFSKGDRSILQNLLSPELYQSYIEVIQEREEKGETWESEIVDLKKSLISDAKMIDGIAHLTVDFEAIEKVTVRDSKGSFIGDEKGMPEQTENRWVFAKDLKDKKTSWMLIETQEIGDDDV